MLCPPLSQPRLEEEDGLTERVAVVCGLARQPEQRGPQLLTALIHHLRKQPGFTARPQTPPISIQQSLGLLEFSLVHPKCLTAGWK